MQTDRSLPELTSALGAQIGDLLRNEVRLAAAEAVEATRPWKLGVLEIGAGVACGASAITLALLSVAVALSEAMPLWAGLAIGALIAAAAAGLFIGTGTKAFNIDRLTFPRTSLQVARDARTIKEKIT